MQKENEKIEAITAKLNELPSSAANAALERYSAQLEGFAEGFAAGKAYAQTEAK